MHIIIFFELFLYISQLPFMGHNEIPGSAAADPGTSQRKEHNEKH